ncbi:type VI secretion system Vgr family protein [Hymenobacter terrenus]|uniref:type VI secretion system Vgr family protein n=1 Tax=Hymenobacter terrenus TaxID=1629124 RepID=UPI00061994BF|nr:type VI secretion system Vgr family protein [Hymenobacter terrenus]
MSLPIVTHLSIGKKKITDFSNLVIQQSLFGHHHVSVEIPFDVLEGSEHGFLTSAHEDLVAQPITVSFSSALPAARDGQPAAAAYTFAFKGLVTHLEVGTQGDLTGSFSVQGFSPTYVLTDVPRYRTFRKKTLADIFRTVLKAYPSNRLAQQLKPATTAPIGYVAQYGESDFVFLHRLAAQHGEWLYYDGTALCLGRPTGDALPFHADGVRAGCQLRFGVQAADTAVAQYQPGRHEVLRANSSSQSVPWVGQHPLTAFAAKTSADLFPDAGVRSPTVVLDSQPALARYAAQLKSQQAARLVTCKGWGENPNMTLGRIIDASGKGLGTRAVAQESFGKYLLTTVTHIIDQDNYHNVFEAVPWSAEHPPLNPHVQPPVGHPELAEVIDLKDPERLGRLRLRYPWQVASPADAETDWVRMTTPYSGDGKGQLFNPELGSQVLVGYEQNRAETPVVLGNLVHGQNKQAAKYSPADNHLKGLQTAGGNKFVMKDTKGEQHILISNSNNKGTAVAVSFKGDGSVHIHSNGPVTVNGSVITLDAGEKGEIKMHAKNITMVAEDDVMVSSKTKGISLSAKEKMALTSKELLAAGSDKATVESNTELALNGGSKATLQSGKTKVH